MARAREQSSLAQAWTTAALSRAKRMPRLARLLAAGKPKRQSPAELAKARAEHQALMEAAEEEA